MAFAIVFVSGLDLVGVAMTGVDWWLLLVWWYMIGLSDGVAYVFSVLVCLVVCECLRVWLVVGVICCE